MKVHQIFVSIFLACFFAMNALEAQAPKPMVAYRIGIDWHFYNTKNELMFPVNEVIAPPMVSAYFHGWCRVGLPGVIEGMIVIRDGVINEKGIEVPLAEMPDGYRIVGIDKEDGKKIITISNWVNIGCVNEQGKRVPAKALWHWQRLGNGWGAGYGTMTDNPDEQAEVNFPSAGESEMEYEIWDINNATLLFKLKAEEIGHYAEGYLTAKKDGLWGFVDKKGNWTISPRFQDLGAADIMEDDTYDDFYKRRSLQNGVIPAQTKDGEWGLVNAKGTWLLKGKYAEVSYAGDGNWFYKLPDAQTWVLCDAKGKLWKDLEFDAPQKIRQGCLFTNQIDKWELVNAGGKVFYATSEPPLYLGDGYYCVITAEGRTAIIDAKGKLIKILEEGTSISITGTFSYGLVAVLVETKEGSKLGYLNTKGEWIIAPGKIPFEGAELPTAMDGFIYIWTGEKHIFYDFSGEKIREDSSDGKWEMMVPLQDGNAGFWAPS